MNVDLGFKLLEFSQRYNIPRLIPEAIGIVKGKMEPEHSFQALEVTRVWKIPVLEDHVMKMIAQ